MNYPAPRTPRQLWWALWAAFQIGVILIDHFLAAGLRLPEAAGPQTYWKLALLPVAASVFLRWIVLPLTARPTSALVVFILGTALAEMAVFLGIFVFPAHHHTLFYAGALGIFQFIPIYSERFSR